jgi:L-lysine 2,3-aminomutase
LSKEGIEMNKEKLKGFLKELKQLEDKYEIRISSSCVEMIDFDWADEPFISGISSQLVFSDENGNEMTIDDLDFNDISD